MSETYVEHFMSQETYVQAQTAFKVRTMNVLALFNPGFERRSFRSTRAIASGKSAPRSLRRVISVYMTRRFPSTVRYRVK